MRNDPPTPLCAPLGAALLVALLTAGPTAGQVTLTPGADVILASDALLMPRSAPYGRAINGVSFQGESVTTIGGYQYSTWYRARGTSDEDLMLARRNLATGALEVMDTGRDLINGDSTGSEGSSAWDAHNVVSMNVSTADGRVHLSYDHHGSQLNYTPSVVGASTGALWDPSILQAERGALNAGGPSLNTITYPEFANSPSGGLTMVYRTGSSGNGNVWLTNYNASTGLWDTPHQIINGSTPLNYTDPVNTSDNRNAYLNGVNYDAQGNIHLTWTWREEATGGSNHDIMYAYSEDAGATWKNTLGAVVATATSPMNLNSPGVKVVTMDRTNTLMNQQAQTVDPDGGVHAIMWHKRDGLPPQTNPAFTATPSAYYHYYRDPQTGAWTRNNLPQDRAVGSRPDVAYDALGNLFVAYVSPGPGDGVGVLDYYTEGDLVLAAATKAGGYQDWRIIHTDTRDFASEPMIDQNRLLDQGVLSVFAQENNDAVTGRTATPLHLIEHTPEVALQWVGGPSNSWAGAAPQAWSSLGNGAVNARFYDGYRVVFDDAAATTAPQLAGTVSPAHTTFRNATRDYTLTSGALAGGGGLTVEGGARVTLDGVTGTFTGAAEVRAGTLALTGGATLAGASAITVLAGADLDVSATATGLVLAAQPLSLAGRVVGDVHAAAGATVSGAGRITGSLSATGALVRVGGAGLAVGPVTEQLLDDFQDTSLGEYTASKVLDQAGSDGGVTNVSFASPAGLLQVTKTAGTEPEQALLLRADHPLAVGDELRATPSIGTVGSQDLGIAVAASASPGGLGSPEAGDVRNDYISIYLRQGQSQLYTRGFNGTTEFSLLGATAGVVEDLFIARTGADTFEVGYYEGGARTVITTRTVANTGIGAAVGFYTDMRNAGTISGLDNLRVYNPTATGPLGETLTIDGGLDLQPTASLELDIHAAGAHDTLVVGGTLAAGGALRVTLDPASPPLAAGDAFDLLDFSALTGLFDAVELPVLPLGLRWDNSALLTSGVLAVATGLQGDFDGDGLVGIADYAVWRDAEGDQGAGLAADANADFRVDPSDYLLWSAHFGASLSNPLASLQAPEPGAAALATAAAALLTLRRRR